MTLDLPEQLDELGRRRWVDALAAEWAQPGHGALGGPVIVIRITRGRLVTWAAGHPWPTYTAEQCFDLIEDYCERHAYAAKLFRDIPSTRFGLADPKEWAGLTWDLVLACAPVRFAQAGLKLDVLYSASMNELLRRMNHEQPGAWGVIVAMSCFEMPPSTPAGREIAERIFPGWGPRLDALAAEGRHRLLAMVSSHLPAAMRERLRAERGEALVETRMWAAAREFCKDKSVRDLMLAVLRGDLRQFARRAANRVQNDDRSQYGQGIETPERVKRPDGQEVDEIRYRHITEVEVSFETLEVLELELTDTIDVLHGRIDLHRGLAHLQRLAAEEPTLGLGMEVLIARELDKIGWEILEARYGHHRTTLTRWMKAALEVLRQKLEP